MNTREIGKLSQSGGSLFNIEHSNEGLITFPGGIPVRDKNSNLVRVIGISGSVVENNHMIAKAVLEAFVK